MKKVIYILLVLVLMMSSFVLGVFVSERLTPALSTPEQETPSAAGSVQSGISERKVRVFDGDLQWFDGGQWRVLGRYDAFAADDPFRMLALAAAQASDAVQPDEIAAPYGQNRGTGQERATGGSGGGSGSSGGSGGGSSGGGSSSGDGEDLWSGDILA